MIELTYQDTWAIRNKVLGDLRLTYSQYLESKEWKTIRKKAKRLKKYKECAVCGTKKAINLHHKSYRFLGTNKAMTDLMPLCEKHHSLVHKFAKETNISIRKASIPKKFKKWAEKTDPYLELLLNGCVCLEALRENFEKENELLIEKFKKNGIRLKLELFLEKI